MVQWFRYGLVYGIFRNHRSKKVLKALIQNQTSANPRSDPASSTKCFASQLALASRCLSCSFSAFRLYPFTLASGRSFHSALTTCET